MVGVRIRVKVRFRVRVRVRVSLDDLRAVLPEAEHDADRGDARHAHDEDEHEDLEQHLLRCGEMRRCWEMRGDSKAVRQ